MIRKLVASAAIVAGTVGFTAGAASATHAHTLQHEQNDVCVDRGGQGFGTGDAHSDTSFHEKVHTGKAGTFAFKRENNPIEVYGYSTC